MVGAPRFELGTSCAQGRRATRLRYAPTIGTSVILLYFAVSFLVIITRTVYELCKLAAILRYCAQSSELQVVEKQEAFLTLELSEAAHLARKAGASFLLRIPRTPSVCYCLST